MVTPKISYAHLLTEPNPKHVDSLLKFFENGCSKRGTGGFGVEIEHLPVHNADDTAVSYYEPNGIETLLRRIRANEAEIAIPVFDRTVELSRAGAAIISQDVKFVLVEGNYLLLDEEPWSRLGPLFDFSIYLDVPREELDRRLVDRWDKHGKSAADARAWIDSNDMPNIDRVLQRRRSADMVMKIG